MTKHKCAQCSEERHLVDYGLRGTAQTTQIVSILGETWEVVEGTKDEYPGLANCSGYADSSLRRIVVDSMERSKDDPEAKGDLQAYKKSVIRHEVVHAFLEESGLSSNSVGADHWADNEEMVDWFALQAPKIYKVLADLRAL